MLLHNSEVWREDTDLGPLPLRNFVKKKSLKGACRYRIASRRWCILISSFPFVLLVCFIDMQIYITRSKQGIDSDL